MPTPPEKARRPIRTPPATRPSRRSRARLASFAALILAAPACASTVGAARPGAGVPTTVGAGRAAAVASGTTVDAGRAGLRLIVEPGAGMTPIYQVLSSPRHTLDMTMYELVDTTAERILAADATRGVRVRVVLDRNRERARNSAAYGYLNAHGVNTRWAPASYEATHEKAAVVDAGRSDARALIMTLNLTSRYYSSTRDYAVVDAGRSDVSAVESVFDADFAGRTSASPPAGADLVWSPGSQATLVWLLGSARQSVLVENEEMSSRPVVDALEGVARRSVRTRLVMTSAREYDAELSELVSAGVGVHTYPDTSSALYIHGKVIVVDAGTAHAHAFVGSENFSTASLDDNRELGLVITNPAVVDDLAATMAHDYAGAPAFRRG